MKLLRTFASGVIAGGVCALLYIAFLQYGFKYALSALSLSMVAVIMFFRCNDLGWRPGFFWMKRRIGFILVGSMPLAVLYAHALNGALTLTWFDTLFHVGLALVFMTTPYLPPLWEWLSKGHFSEPDQRGMPRRRATDKGSDIT